MRKKSVEDLLPESLDGVRLIVRVDYNVPLRNGDVADDTRIRRTLPTLRHLCARGAALVLVSHLGRPGGRPDPSASLAPVADRLGELFEFPTRFSGDTVGPAALDRVAQLEPGHVILMENARFFAGETGNDPTLAAAMAALGDHFVNDAFGAAHRAHASTTGVAAAVRERGGEAVAGYLMEAELRFLGDALASPERPFVAVLGGAKISGKIDVIDNLLSRVDRLIIGGAMANTFLRALGLEIGNSLVEEDRVTVAREILEKAGDRVLLPVDCIVAPAIARDAETRCARRDQVAGEDKIGDIGPDSRSMFSAELARARTIVWNGPMGVFEMPPFARGTFAVAEAVAGASDSGAVTIVGGGDSASAAEAAGVADRLTHVSTGGGASLEFLAGRPLPGVEALSNAD